MIIVMQKKATEEQIQHVIDMIHQHGLQEHLSRGKEVTIIGALGNERIFDPTIFECLPGVDRAVPILKEWQIISRDVKYDNTVLSIRKVLFGEGKMVIPTLQNYYEDPFEKYPDSSCFYIDPFYISNRPYEAVNHERLRSLSSEIAHLTQHIHENNKTIMIRIRNYKQLEVALQNEVDIIYVGGELMNNWVLNKEMGRLNTPMVLCKDKHHTVDEWLMAAERVALEGNGQIILGDSGTLSLSKKLSYRLDVEAIAVAHELSHLPILANIHSLVSPYLKEKTLLDISFAAGAQMVVI